MKKSCLSKEVIGIFFHLFVNIRETEVGILLHFINELIYNFPWGYFALI